MGKLRTDKDKSAFRFGHLFEAALTMHGEELAAWLSAHPEMSSKSGPRKGQLLAELSEAPEMAAAVRRSRFLGRIIRRSRKQVILTGTLFGLPVRVMMDLLDNDGSIYDIKAMRNFQPIYDPVREEYLDWWAYWNYPMQLYIYREIARQNGIRVPRVGLIAASKSNHDVQAISFGEEIMEAAASDVEYTMHRMADVLYKGETPEMCGQCSWCVSRKRIICFEEL